MPTSPSSANLQQVRQEAMRRLFGSFVGTRLAFTPLLLLLPLWVVLTEETLWRRLVMAGVCICLVGLSWLELQRFQRHGLRPRSFPLNLGISVSLQLVVVVVTGGIESPMLPALLPLAVLVSVILRPGWPHYLALISQIVVLWGMLFVQATGRVPELLPQLFQETPGLRHNPVHLLVGVGVMTVLLLVSFQIGARLRGIYDAMLHQALAARDDTLWTYTENLQRLTTMTGEIAHELKNPLGSIKGLAALVARDMEGKSAERMKVLRQEINRMQDILNEFLNFSRPLGPLSQEQVSLRELCENVLLLHEGMASERRLTLRLHPGAEIAACCDAGKVKQVLINLLQNALEASPPDQEVCVEIAPLGPAQARISVLDRGPGLTGDSVERLFQAGVTSKPQGSGLGLPIARSLARQHGGELSLHPREGGGCHAMMVLPLMQPPPAPPLNGSAPSQEAPLA
ncbi:His Kinase A (phospho-acceptor) domain-containing protein [Stigmatella aurantiaca]|uniref:histidine kinase n=1 Tax=Stigmatella aurantiaca TaxID=41 RepID=A0A1H7Y4S8_STIAU|nr:MULTISPECIES: HAMP domain-containing sensor histidine kinase [Stigmatella]SEM41162.1 His Kinase A (phospho-acceptor) domain-containing protein [Stigmatella aurantiaca]